MYTNYDYLKPYRHNADHSYHDIRKLPQILSKSNLNFIETLFPYDIQKTSQLYGELLEMRNEITTMNLPYLYDSCFGMYSGKMKDFDRDTSYTPTNIYTDKNAEEEYLLKYWDDAYEIDFSEKEEIVFTARFPQPDYFVKQ
jgi:predicted nucleotidyltransferase